MTRISFAIGWLRAISLAAPYKDPYFEGSWYGNDTLWRMGRLDDLAWVHAVENATGQQVGVTMGLLVLLGAMFLKGFREVIVLVRV